MQSLRGIWVIKLTNIAASTFASDITNSFIDSSCLIILRKYNKFYRETKTKTVYISNLTSPTTALF